MQEHVIKIDADGNVTCLYSDELPLREMGTLTVERASNVEFSNERGGWLVEFADGRYLVEVTEADWIRYEAARDWVGAGRRLAVFQKREQALAAEVAYLQSHL